MHHHLHAHPPATGSPAFVTGIALNVLFVLVGVYFGLRAHSLSLLADAGHNLGDVLGLVLAWVAVLLGRRPPSPRHTYGMRRASILAALANAVLLLVAVGGIAWEAVKRLHDPPAVASGVVMLVAGIGVVINSGTALLFLSGRKHDLNVRGAFLHMAADAGVSLGVVLAGWAIGRTGWLWLDPVVSLAISAVIVWGTWSLFRESLRLALDAVPSGIELAAVEEYLVGLPGVTAVHDLHVWAMSTTEVALTAHLVKPDAEVDDALLGRLNRELDERFGIGHATIQLERSDHHCGRATGTAV